jgi:hypothetical protein
MRTATTLDQRRADDCTKRARVQGELFQNARHRMWVSAAKLALVPFSAPSWSTRSQGRMFRHAILWSDSLAPSSHSGSLATPLFGQSLMALSASLSLLHARLRNYPQSLSRGELAHSPE